LEKTRYYIGNQILSNKENLHSENELKIEIPVFKNDKDSKNKIDYIKFIENIKLKVYIY